MQKPRTEKPDKGPERKKPGKALVKKQRQMYVPIPPHPGNYKSVRLRKTCPKMKRNRSEKGEETGSGEIEIDPEVCLSSCSRSFRWAVEAEDRNMQDLVVSTCHPYQPRPPEDAYHKVRWGIARRRIGMRRSSTPSHSTRG